jgi:hypothetical protein
VNLERDEIIDQYWAMTPELELDFCSYGDF